LPRAPESDDLDPFRARAHAIVEELFRVREKQPTDLASSDTDPQLGILLK